MKQNDFIFKALTVIAWVIFVALCIEACALLVNFIYSLYNPAVLKNLYQKLDLSEMYNRSTAAYYSIYTFILVIAFLKAGLFYDVIKLVSKLDLNRPFSSFVSKQISSISYTTFAIGLISIVARQTANNLSHKGYDVNILNTFWVDSQAYILMAGVIYAIATIFKRGIEIQNENDSTI
ncbi:MAG: hypothetical protein RLZZ520_138 [Bacteroidota bacterium]|jgi:hypothetical protein